MPIHEIQKTHAYAQAFYVSFLRVSFGHIGYAIILEFPRFLDYEEIAERYYSLPRCLWKPHEAESACKYTQFSQLKGKNWKKYVKDNALFSKFLLYMLKSGCFLVVFVPYRNEVYMNPIMNLQGAEGIAKHSRGRGVS